MHEDVHRCDSTHFSVEADKTTGLISATLRSTTSRTRVLDTTEVPTDVEAIARVVNECKHDGYTSVNVDKLLFPNTPCWHGTGPTCRRRSWRPSCPQRDHPAAAHGTGGGGLRARRGGLRQVLAHRHRTGGTPPAGAAPGRRHGPARRGAVGVAIGVRAARLGSAGARRCRHARRAGAGRRHAISDMDFSWNDLAVERQRDPEASGIGNNMRRVSRPGPRGRNVRAAW